MTVGLARLLVRAASRLAPPLHRPRFVREWDAELWHALRAGGGGRETLVAALGAFADARALRDVERTFGRTTMGDWWSGLGRDARTAARGLARSPAFSVVAVLTLGLGIGGTAAIWTLVDRVVLDPLPYPASERLVRLQNQVPGVAPDAVWNTSTAQYVFFDEEARTLETVGLYRGGGGTLSLPSGPVRANGVQVTASVLDLLGAEARAGRLLGPDDDRPDAPPTAVLSHAFWRQVLGGDPAVVGGTLTFNDRPVTVVGVLEPGLELPGWPGSLAPDLWMPMGVDRAGPFYNNHVIPMIGRLAADATPEAAEEEIARLTARLPERFPTAYGPTFFDRYGFRTQVVPLKQDVLGDMDRNLWILFGAVGLVLLIVCANVGNLFMVRAEGRRGELGVRAALGASRTALGRYLMAEGLVLAGAGATLGAGVALWGVPALLAAAPGELPRMREVGMGVDTVLFALGLSLLVGLVVAAWPTLVHTGAAATRTLGDGGRAATHGRERQRLRSAMVMSQVALALTLSVGAGLLVQSLQALRAADLGFEPEGVVLTDVYPSRDRYPDADALWAFYRQVLEGVRALPGVSAAGMGLEVPVQGGYGCTVQMFEDDAVYQRVRDAGMTTCAGQEMVTPGYFEALGMRVVEGRPLTEADHDDPGRGAVVVSRAFAERFWPGESALGKGVSPPGMEDPPFYHVVGVVDDVPARGGDGKPPLSEKAVAIYYPVTRIAGAEARWWLPAPMTLVVKAQRVDPSALLPAIRRTVGAIDPETPVANLTSMETVVAGAAARLSFVSLLLAIAAAVALLLSALGIYGVLAYVVGRRTREIGMRMAMGARPGEVQGMIVGRSLLLVAGGLAAGVALALATTRVMQGLLVGVEPTSPAAFVSAVALLGGVAALASWIPARRASRVDPAVALRSE